MCRVALNIRVRVKLWYSLQEDLLVVLVVVHVTLLSLYAEALVRLI